MTDLIGESRDSLPPIGMAPGMLSEADFASFLANVNIPGLLKKAASNAPQRLYASTGDHAVTLDEFFHLVQHTVAALAKAGLSASSCVMVGSRNSIAHSAIIFAL